VRCVEWVGRCPSGATQDQLVFGVGGKQGVVLWYCGTVVLWYCGTVVLWYCGTVVLWLDAVPVKDLQGMMEHGMTRAPRRGRNPPGSPYASRLT
jgi:hypothetical protein